MPGRPGVTPGKIPACRHQRIAASLFAIELGKQQPFPYAPGRHHDIVRPAGCELLDYEIELALVLKKDLPPNTVVTGANLLDYVGGFTLTNDVSARDFMFGAV